MRFIPLLLLLTLSACQVRKKPDLAELYQQHGTDHSNTPLVLIHGTMGSKLRMIDSLEEVWPGKINHLIFSNYKKLANQINPNGDGILESTIESYEIFDSYSGLSIYDEIIKTLVEYGDYHVSDINQTALSGKNLYIFHYDWRQDNVYNAQKLANYIQQVLVNHPEHQKVDVVAHSMGGLILRYYQRFGDQDVLDSLDELQQHNPHSHAQFIRHAIFLGTPQLGSVKSVKRLQAGFDFNLRNIPVEVQITMPSVYQLLPHPLSQSVVDVEGNHIDLDFFDVTFWRQNQLSIFNPEVQSRIIKQADDLPTGKAKVARFEYFFEQQLKRAALFWQALSPEFEIDHEGFIVMGGDCKKTLNKLIINDTEFSVDIRDDISFNDEFDVRALHKSILFEPGDGQVSKSSLLGQIHDPISHQTIKTIKIKYPVFVCEDHIKLTQNITFQDNLLHVLLNE